MEEKIYCVVYFKGEESKSWSGLDENEKDILIEAFDFLDICYEVYSKTVE